MGLESIVVGDSNLYDALIIGGGPAGLSAALYLARANKRVGFIEKNNPGGKLVSIAEIKNYPGFANVSGNDLAMSFFNQATEAGAEYI
jgi:thioredoxin reductase (NADPH)